jgi:hypothetical protein
VGRCRLPLNTISFFASAITRARCDQSDAANRNSQVSVNLFITAPASLAHHLDNWAARLWTCHESDFDYRDGLSGRFVRSCLRRNAGSGKGGAYRASGALLPVIEGGTDCGFTSYARCLATASGIGAECYGDTFRDDELLATAAGPANTGLLDSPDRAAVQAHWLSGQIISNQPP